MAVLVVKQSPGAGEYGSWNAAEAVATGSDSISIEGSWTADDTTAVTKSAAAPVTVAASAAHPGYYNTSDNHYRLNVSSGAHAVTVNAGGTIDGVVVRQSAAGNSDECFRVTASTTIKNAVIWNSGGGSNQDCVYTSSDSLTITLEQCIVYDADRACIHLQQGDSCTFNINSCTIYNGKGTGTSGEAGGGIGMAPHTGNSATCNVHNTISIGNGKDYNESTLGTITWGISYSIDGDNTISARDGGGAGNLANRTETANASPGAGDWVIFTNITAGSEDLRLQDNATDNDAQDMHSTATAEGLTIPSTDIVGTSRVTDYECGAFTIAGGKTTDSIGPGTLTLTGLAPDDGQVVRDSIGPGTLTLTGFAPSEGAETITDQIDPGTLTLTGFAPDDHQTVIDSIGNGTIILAGLAPADHQIVRDLVDPGSLTLAGLAPADGQVVKDLIDSGTLVLAGFAPDTNQIGTITDAPGAGALNLTGFAPDAYNPADRLAKDAAGGGPVRDRRKRRWRVKIGDRFYWVSSQAELRFLLQAYAQQQRIVVDQEKAKPQTETRIKRIKVIRQRVRRAEQRLEKVERDYIRELDDEILTYVVAGLI